jgi:hypothetical protein
VHMAAVLCAVCVCHGCVLTPNAACCASCTPLTVQRCAGAGDVLQALCWACVGWHVWASARLEPYRVLSSVSVLVAPTLGCLCVAPAVALNPMHARSSRGREPPRHALTRSCMLGDRHQTRVLLHTSSMCCSLQAVLCHFPAHHCTTVHLCLAITQVGRIGSWVDCGGLRGRRRTALLACTA